MINMEPCLADDKLQKRNAQLLAMHKCRKTTLKALQSLIGLLNFTCSVVLPCRAFLQRLIDLTKGVCLLHHRIQITEACPHDLQVWLQFLRDFNHRIFFLDEAWQVSPALKLYTDAVGSNGYGTLFGKCWFYREWPASWKSLNIAFLELFPITLFLCVWGCQMSNKCVSLLTDNTALVDIINKQTSKYPIIMMKMNRSWVFFLCCSQVKQNIKAILKLF